MVTFKTEHEATGGRPMRLLVVAVAAALLNTAAVAVAADMPVKAVTAATTTTGSSLTVYTFDDFIRFRSAFPGREYTSRGLISNNGFTYAVTPQFVFGAGFTYGHSNNNLDYLGA